MQQAYTTNIMWSLSCGGGGVGALVKVCVSRNDSRKACNCCSYVCTTSDIFWLKICVINLLLSSESNLEASLDSMINDNS